MLRLKHFLTYPVKDSEQLLINNILKIKASGKSHSMANVLFCTLKHFYLMNDIRINEREG